MSTKFIRYIVSVEDLGSAKMTGFAATAQKVGMGLTKYVTLPLVGMGAASAKMATDFGGSMNKIRALVGASQKQVDTWSKQILDLAAKLPQSPKELADAMYFITSSGISGSKALEVLTASARAAAAGLGDTQQVADAVTSALNAYRGTGLTAGKTTDILTAAVREGKAEADQFAGSIGRVIPVASQLGVGFDQVAASMASMTLSGLDADEAATATRGILNALLKPSAQAQKEIAKLGLSFEDVRQSLKEKGLLATLTMLKDRVGNNQEAMGRLFPRVRALNGFLALTGANADQTSQLFNELAHSTGATDAAFKSASESAGFKFKAALSSLQVAAVKVGAQMLPALTAIAGWLGKLADWFGNLPKPVQRTIMTFALLAASIGPVLLMAAKMVKSFEVLKEAMKSFQVASKLAALGNPWVLLAATIAAVALLIITHWDKVKRFTAAAWHGILVAVKAVWNWIKGNWPYLLGILVGPIGLAVGMIVKHWGTITKTASAAFRAVVSWFKSLPGRIAGAVGSLATLLVLAGRNVIDGLWRGIRAAWNSTIAWVRRIRGWISGVFNAARTWLLEAGKNVIRGLWDGLTFVWRKVTGWISGLARWIKEHKGPLALDRKLLEPAGRALMQGLKVGLLGGFLDIRHIISGAAGNLQRWFTTSIGQGFLGKIIKGGLVDIGKIPGALWGGLKGIGGFFSKLFGGGGNAVDGWIKTALALAKAPASWLGALKVLVGKESGGNPNAVNSISVGGEHASGLFQTLPSTFAAYAIKGLGGIFNPVANAVAGIRYIMARYGSPYNIPHLFATGPYGSGGTYVGYARGTTSATRGWHWVGEEGRELAYFTGGERVLSARRSAELATDTPPNITVNARIVFPGGKSQFAEVVVDSVEYGRVHGVTVPWGGR